MEDRKTKRTRDYRKTIRKKELEIMLAVTDMAAQTNAIC